MKKTKLNSKIIIIVILAILALAILGLITYRILNDENKLTVEEKEWITENVNVVQNLSVPNNLDIFGKSGSGVFFDFIKSLETEYNLNVNEITYNLGEDVKEGSFKVVYDLDDTDVLFYKEHYVVISKEKIEMSNISQLSNRKIAETIAQALNVPVLELHSTSNLTQEDFDNGETYISLMERNLKVLEKLFIIEENE